VIDPKFQITMILDRPQFGLARAGLARKPVTLFIRIPSRACSGKADRFSEKNRLQLFDFEPLLLARMIQPEPKMLESRIFARSQAEANCKKLSAFPEHV
jgi:hypothetical protein